MDLARIIGTGNEGGSLATANGPHRSPGSPKTPKIDARECALAHFVLLQDAGPVEVALRIAGVEDMEELQRAVADSGMVPCVIATLRERFAQLARPSQKRTL